MVLSATAGCDRGGGEADGGLDADARSDGDADDGCLRGDNSGQQGDPCTCSDDCEGVYPYCGYYEDPEETYCVTIGCTRVGENACPPGSGCIGEGSWISLCVQCLGRVGGLGDDCVCDEDCGTTPVGGEEWPMSCLEQECKIACGPTNPCPADHICEPDSTGDWCRVCLNPELPGERGDRCVCDSDCEEGVTCSDHTCGITGCEPRVSGECPEGEVCTSSLSDETICQPMSDECTGSGDRTNGMSCHCDADCDESAPICLHETIGSHELAGCFKRPCDPMNPHCPLGPEDLEYVCCYVPNIIEEWTCMPATIMLAVGLLIPFCFQ